MMSPLWNTTLYAGTHIEMSSATAHDLWYGSFNETTPLRYDVALSEQSDHCVAQVDFSMRRPELGKQSDFSGRITLQQGVPLPVRYEVKYGFGHSAAILQDRATATGPPLPTARTLNPLLVGLGLTALQDGFAAGSEDLFPTGATRAIQEAHANQAANGWFSAHPRAILVRGSHILGGNGSALQNPTNPQVKDEWDLVWGTPDGAGLEATVDYAPSEPSLPVFGGTYQVSSGPVVEFANATPGRMVSATDINAAYQAIHGHPIEVLVCEMLVGTCQAGTHQSTNAPRAGQTAAGRIFPGLIVWASKGFLLQDDSSDDKALGPPA
ncbi:MAG: hypothetical protein ACYDBQ_05910 [Thermoplasmatota archaeon]